jgi:4-alpha-glucanotransferase
VWAAPEQFQLDEDGLPTEVAGCPPDAFTADGQLWGNPLFRWEDMKKDGYAWWLRRISFQFQLYDILRIDHFRGFEAYYAIPYGDETARNGQWRPGPGLDFFKAVEQALGKREIIAEDLGFLTEEVYQLLRDTGYPGMKVLEFAFDDPNQDSEYLPYHCPAHSVVYAGTHDNDTILGWLAQAAEPTAQYAKEFLRLNETEGYHWGVLRAVWGTAAELTIVQLQDVLGLGSEARINTPSTKEGNWQWRALPDSWDEALAEKLRHEMKVYHRLVQ